MRSHPVEELDQVEEIQSGGNHWENQKIRADHPKSSLVKEQSLARLRQGQVPFVPSGCSSQFYNAPTTVEF